MSKVDMEQLLKGVTDQMAADPDGTRDSQISPRNSRRRSHTPRRWKNFSDCSA
jgi:hypothetical protein